MLASTLWAPARADRPSVCQLTLDFRNGDNGQQQVCTVKDIIVFYLYDFGTIDESPSSVAWPFG